MSNGQKVSPPSSAHAYELPGSSPLFPRDVENLLKMSPGSLRELLDDYGLLVHDDQGRSACDTLKSVGSGRPEGTHICI